MSVDEKVRLADPSGKLDAIVVERGTDATVASPTQVFIEPKGQVIRPDTKSEPVLIADHVEKTEVTWVTSGRVRINIKGGRIFRHFAMDKPSGVVIEVFLDGAQHKPETGPPP